MNIIQCEHNGRIFCFYEDLYGEKDFLLFKGDEDFNKDSLTELSSQFYSFLDYGEWIDISNLSINDIGEYIHLHESKKNIIISGFFKDSPNVSYFIKIKYERKGEIARHEGIRLYVNSNEANHANTPHFHVDYDHKTWSIPIDGKSVLAGGKIPKKAQKQIDRWLKLPDIKQKIIKEWNKNKNHKQI